MTTDPRHRRVMERFTAACDLDEEERRAFLEALAVEDPDLRAEVESLLARDVGHDDGLFDEGVDLLDALAAEEKLPQTVGSYRIVSVLGRGGMGIVYLAEQATPRRRVALKVIGSAWCNPGALRRFEIESEVLGRLKHPGIAAIYEAGTERTPHGETPYFAMELVEGDGCLAFAAKRELSIEERVELLVRICDAIAFAHLRGVIHRDLKPENVRVDQDGQPKVLDFGVARLVDVERDSAKDPTIAGQVLGTLAYMSPEQAEGRSDDIDLRTDVYGLGTIGYELLTGSRPRDVDGMSLMDAVRVIAEKEVPPASQHDRRLRGDLERILAKALHGDREQRYPSASSLAEDLRRFLTHQPIHARPPSLAYGFAKFARRHRIACFALAVVLLAIVGGGTAATYGLLEAEKQRDAAKRERDEAIASLSEANAVSTFLRTTLEAAAPTEFGREVTVLQAIDESVRRLDTGAETPRAEQQIRLALGEAYAGIGRPLTAHEQFTRSLELARDLYPETSIRTLQAKNRLASTLIALERLPEAEALVGEVFAAGEAPVREAPHLLLDARRVQADLAMARRDYATAKRQLTALLSDEKPAFRGRWASLAFDIAQCDCSLGNLDEALRWVQAIKPEVERAAGEESFEFLELENLEAQIYRTQGRLHQALELHETTLARILKIAGPEHPRTLSLRNAIALIQVRLQRFQEAIDTFRELVDLRRRLYPEGHPANLDALENLAWARGESARFDEAIPRYEEALARRQERAEEQEQPSAAYLALLSNLAFAYSQVDRDAESEELTRRALALKIEHLGASHRDTLTSQYNLGHYLVSCDRNEEAEPFLSEAVQRAKESFPADSWLTWEFQNGLGTCLMNLGRHSEAERLLLEAWEKLGDCLSEEHGRTRVVAYNLHLLYDKLNRPEEARSWRERAGEMR